MQGLPCATLAMGGFSWAGRWLAGQRIRECAHIDLHQVAMANHAFIGLVGPDGVAICSIHDCAALSAPAEAAGGQVEVFSNLQPGGRGAVGKRHFQAFLMASDC